MTARRLAFEVLMKMHGGAYSNISLGAALSGQQSISEKDRALASNIVYGVTERCITLDYQLDALLDKPLCKLKAEVLTVLRMGIYQLFFCDKIPDSAAVNESVRLVRDAGCAYAAGLVNAVLRRAAGQGLLLPAQEGTAYYLSVKYSCNKDIVSELRRQYGMEVTEKILSHSLTAAPVSIRVNTLKTSTEALMQKLCAEGISCEKSYICSDALNIMKTGGAIDRLKSFREGLFHVQDISCQLCCEALGAKKGETVLDMCAAPGGKSFTVAEIMQNEGTVKAFDIYPHKTALIDEGAERLGTDIVVSCVHDATVYRPTLAGADRVLCDVPCSGLGIMAKKPEIKYKSLSELQSLPQLQQKILQNAARYLKPSGTLVYSTCTLRKQENEDVCDFFLSEQPDFEKCGEYVTILPGENGCDGFFYAVMRRCESRE